MAGFEAVVVAGGESKRLGGRPKAELEVAGTSLRRRAMQAVSDATVVQVVGPEVDGGPVAAVASALDEVQSRVVVVLACDMPLVTRETVARLIEPLTDETEAALLVDADGRQQYLAGAYLTEALRRRLDEVGEPRGASMHRLVEGLRVSEVAEQSGEALDCDTWDDVTRANELLEGR